MSNSRYQGWKAFADVPLEVMLHLNRFGPVPRLVLPQSHTRTRGSGQSPQTHWARAATITASLTTTHLSDALQMLQKPTQGRATMQMQDAV